MSKLPLSYEEFRQIYSKVTRVNVELFLIINNELVLTKRSIEPCIGQWHIPGGTIRFGETPEETLHRVALEELGVKISIEKQIGIICYPKLKSDGYFGWPLGIAYTARLVSGELRGSEQGEEVDTFKKLPTGTIEDQVDFVRVALPSFI